MKAVQLIEPKQPLEMRDIPIPQPGPGDVLVRVKAAGICHSDAHYRSGLSYAGPLPLTPGHEVAGVVEQVGKDAGGFEPGERVCVHYLATCGECTFCAAGTEQFCTTGKMIGKHRDGGYAEWIAVPARSVFRLPPEISFEAGAIMMCSSSTSLHALLKARLKPGESVAIFGIGGLGISAVQLASALGAGRVFAVDINEKKLRAAEQFGAVSINAALADPVQRLKALTAERGVDVALELIGLPLTMRQAVQSLAVMGRAALVGLSDGRFEIAPYTELLNKEAEIIGVSDHLAGEMPLLLEFARTGKLSFPEGVIKRVALDADAINHTLDALEQFSDDLRVVITP